jgi:hypothetical protein
MNLTPEQLRLILLGIVTLILIAYCGLDAWRSGGRDRDGVEP